MPAVLGPFQIFSVSGGVIHYGDTLIISPKNSVKSSAGGGGLNTGAFIVTYTGLNNNAVFNTTGLDQPTIGNL
ncbi:spore germination protein [Bacillus sp. FJAT-52991]|uniref:Spore germination protein n=1 Tax=Bacillus kandeliae TaxID=3129297 RepID=A0ABZ2N9M4_9BACI